NMEEPTEENVFSFQDEKTSPDPIHDYPKTLLESRVPLVIDNGAYQCRAGWASDEDPRLFFKNVLVKQRGKKESETQVGNDITNIEVVRWQLKSQFDRNVITQYDVQEQIFDYLFSHMGIDSDGSVQHPICMTEPACNPNYCRLQMSELLFECYGVPEICYGVDSLFSLYNNLPQPGKADAMVISCGYYTTHILPVLDGRLDGKHCRRINIGGANCDLFMHRLLQLKYPGHYAAISVGRAEELVHKHSYMSKNYLEELKLWGTDNYYNKNVHKIQLPYTKKVEVVVDPELQKARREVHIKRLKELAAKRREAQLINDESKLRLLLNIKHMAEEGKHKEQVKQMMENLDLEDMKELQVYIDKFTGSIQRAKVAMARQDNEEKKGSAVDIFELPDEKLTSAQREAKRKEQEMEERRRQDFNGWLKEIQTERQGLVEKRTIRKQRRSDMAKRRTFASQQRMKIISQLAAGSKKKRKDDTFGMDDSDWNVYKQINKDAGDSDSEAEQERLDELETLLREYDPNFEREKEGVFDIAEHYKLHVGVERIRVPELLFQPCMVG
ncbi:unnamed protein product, partial [Owenia fusiformis]